MNDMAREEALRLASTVSHHGTAEEIVAMAEVFHAFLVADPKAPPPALREVA